MLFRLIQAIDFKIQTAIDLLDKCPNLHIGGSCQSRTRKKSIQVHIGGGNDVFVEQTVHAERDVQTIVTAVDKVRDLQEMATMCISIKSQNTILILQAINNLMRFDLWIS